MTNLYVHAKQGKSAGKFDTKSAPARSIGDVLKVAAAGDIIEILDDATYEEDEIVIDKPLTLVSSYLVANPSANPTDKNFDPKKLPKLTVKQKSQHRVLRITGTPATRVSLGQVVIRGLRIAGGTAVHTSSDPALGAGGGIAVIDFDNVLIEQCVITDNKTLAASITGWPEPDRLAFRAAILDVIDAMIPATTEIILNATIDVANKALALIGGYTPIAHFSRSAMLSQLGIAIDGLIPRGRANNWLGGQAFGAGVATIWANPTIRKCLIRDNVAEGRGAGMAVIGYGWPTIDGCLIHNNKSGSYGRRDGGGVGCEIALPGKLTRNLSEIEVIKLLTSKLSKIKTIIVSPFSHITVSDIIDYVKWLANPFNVSPPVRGIKAAILDLINKREKEAANHLLYFFSTSALSLSKWDAWDQSEIKQAQKKSVAITDCHFSNNWCADDGGGLYASVLSRVNLTKTKIVENVSKSMGGGVRLTMGSSGEFTGCELFGNTALVDDPPSMSKGFDEEALLSQKSKPATLVEVVPGGGGVSARNVDLTLTDTLIGSHSVGINKNSNVCSDHAGGGIAYQADTEGSLAGIPNLWTSILIEVFDVRAVTVFIKANSSIKNNGAGFDIKRAAIPGTTKAKGGGLWLLQGSFPDAPRVKLQIEAVRNVKDNIGMTKPYTSKINKAIHIASADEVCIQDVIGKNEWSESNFASLSSGAGLEFSP